MTESEPNTDNPDLQCEYCGMKVTYADAGVEDANRTCTSRFGGHTWNEIRDIGGVYE